MKAESPLTRSPAQELIDFAQALSLEAIPRKAIEDAKWCLLDSLGCTLFGPRLRSWPPR